MTVEQQCWRCLRDQAQTYLPADFARQVIRRAGNRSRSARREYALIGITAGVCILSVGIVNWYWGNQLQEKNLKLWRVVETQISALRTSI